MRRHVYILSVLACGLVQRVAALAPHELLLAVNENSPRSLELANRYATLRGVPPENIVYLDLPASVLAPAAEISSNAFAQLLWQPLEAALNERHLQGRILGVAYSCDFPVRISTTPALSLTGATFVRGRFPAPDLVATGLYISAFFAGPTRREGAVAPSRSLGWFRDAAPPQRLLPLPAMLLGHAGARGLEPGEILHALALADRPFARPWVGAFCLHTNADLRSQMRDWQFAAACTELGALGAPVCLTNAPPAAGANMLGFMTGAAWPPPPRAAFAPGAYADHCTSFAAQFDNSDQAKLTLWLLGGATLSAGTVVEPYAVWMKFPNARFFAHQVRGCSALECFAQSVCCPLQLLPVGDPLAAPGAPPFSARLVLRAEGLRFSALLELAGAPTNASPRYAFFLDGRAIKNDGQRPGLVFNPGRLPDGYHRLLGVATCGDMIRTCAQARDGFVWNAGGNMPGLQGLTAGARISTGTPLRLTITAPSAAGEVGLAQGARLLARGPARTITLDPARLGAGPVELQPVAWFRDGTTSRGEPVAFEIETATPLPEPAGFHALENFATAFRCLGTLEHTTAGTFTFSTTNSCAVATAPASAVRELAVTLTPTAASLNSGARAGLAFNLRDEKNFTFFGLTGQNSGWTLALVRDGNFTVLAERGRPVRPGQSYRLGVRAGTLGIECLVNREQLWEHADMKLDAAAFGLGVSGSGATFGPLMFRP